MHAGHGGRARLFALKLVTSDRLARRHPSLRPAVLTSLPQSGPRARLARRPSRRPGGSHSLIAAPRRRKGAPRARTADIFARRAWPLPLEATPAPRRGAPPGREAMPSPREATALAPAGAALRATARAHRGAKTPFVTRGAPPPARSHAPAARSCSFPTHARAFSEGPHRPPAKGFHPPAGARVSRRRTLARATRHRGIDPAAYPGEARARPALPRPLTLFRKSTVAREESGLLLSIRR